MCVQHSAISRHQYCLGDYSKKLEVPIKGSGMTILRCACWYKTGQNQGGVIYLRPCRPVARHMLALVQEYQHGHAEQDFFDKYFKCTRMTLPHLSVNGTHMIGGLRPRIVHYTWHKPFVRDDSKSGHSLLWRDGRKLLRRCLHL